MNSRFFLKYLVPGIVILGVFLSGCYKDIAEVKLPDQGIYMPTAVNGNYLINAVAVPGQTFRYTADLTSSKLNIPLSAYRSGVKNNGDVNITIAAKTDTVNTLIASGALSGTLLLPSTSFSLPTAVMIPDGGVLGQFALSVDMNFLLANPGKSYAIAVAISSTQVAPTAKNLTIIVINTAFLTPTANFTTALDANIAKQYNFTNTSTNAINYSWNFGDGSPVVTDKSPSHIFASGTYTITLTSSGVAGSANPSVKTATIVIP